MNIPPQAIDAENSVVGSMLFDSSAITKVMGILQSEDFYDTRNQKIYSAMLNLFGKSITIDLITVSNELNKTIDEYYLTDLTTKVSSSAGVEHHAYVVKEKSLLRKAIKIGHDLSVKAQDSTADPFEVLSNAETKLMEAVGVLKTREPKKIGLSIAPLMDKLSEIHAGKRKTFGVPTGYY